MQAAMSQYLAGPLRSYVFDLLLRPTSNGEPFDHRALKPLLESWLRDSDKDRFMRRPLALMFLQCWWNEVLARSSQPALH